MMARLGCSSGRGRWFRRSVSQPDEKLSVMEMVTLDLEQFPPALFASVPDLPTVIFYTVAFPWDLVIDESLMFCGLALHDSPLQPPFIFLFDHTETLTKADARSAVLHLLDGTVNVTLTNSRGRTATWAVTPRIGSTGTKSPPWRRKLLESL